MTYKDDLDIIKEASKDTKKLTLNAITELDNKGLLDRYSGEEGGESEGDLYPDFDGYFTFDESAQAIDLAGLTFYKLIAVKEPKDASVSGVFFRYNNSIVFCETNGFDPDYKGFTFPGISGWTPGSIVWYSEPELEDEGVSGILQPNTWYYSTEAK